ncbi:MAG: glycosyltransferase [Betaproteobacteria bacterium]|nr:glycosyltransferase [Betaproteobacteria bacterium]
MIDHAESGTDPTITTNKRALRVAYVLAYRAPHYIRSLSLQRALGNCSRIELLSARNHSSGMARYVETWRALRQLRKTHAPDLYILGFRGHEMFWPVRWLTRGKPLVFDALMSPSAALHEENKAGFLGRLIAPLLGALERGILRRADLVLTDTPQHVAFYIRQFGLTQDKLLAVPVGAEEPNVAVNLAATPAADAPLKVLFYGSMLPLHGIDVIIAAAAKLADSPIRFDFIGGSARQARRLRRQCAMQGVTRYTHRRWVPMDELVDAEIPSADVCLGGPFGGTPQARRVVTGKALQSLALAKATVIGAIDEASGFLDKDNCLLVPQADPTALAAALRWCAAHRDALTSIGERGQALYRQRFSVQIITQQLCPALERLHAAHKEQP